MYFINRILFNKYQILDVLGTGGSSTVYLARHLRLQTLRAVKCVNKNHILYKQLINEANILKNLKHPNIPVIYDIEEDKENAYIIEEFLEGMSLKSFCLCHKELQERLIVNYSIQLCNLIQYLHSIPDKVLYLDLKPENIIIHNDILKLVDFGTSISLADGRVCDCAAGTKKYAAPEQKNGGILNEKTDIFGIGKIIYFMASGDLTMSESRVKEILEERNCSDSLIHIIYRCMKRNPLERYHSVSELANALAGITEKSFRVYSGQPLRIAAAGSQAGAGVTHICFLLASYWNMSGISCLCQEQNTHRAFTELIRHGRLYETSDNIWRKRHCNLRPYFRTIAQPKAERVSIIVEDYGVIGEEMPPEYITADCHVIVAGVKEWERERALWAYQLAKQKDLTNTVFLLNYSDRYENNAIREELDPYPSFSVPYEADPFRPEIKRLNRLSLDILSIAGGMEINKKRKWRKHN